MKFESASSDPRVTSSNSRVTSSTLRVTSSNLRVTSLNYELRLQIQKLRVQIHELRVQIHKFKNYLVNENFNLNGLKMSSFPKILSLKSLSNSWGNSYVQFLVIIWCFYFSTISWLRVQQETKWVNINFERRDLTSAEKSRPSPDVSHSFFILFRNLWLTLSSLYVFFCLRNTPLPGISFSFL